MTLMRERQNKLMNFEAMVASVSHEVRQPLAAIVSNGGAALRFLRHEPPNLEEVRSALNRMVTDSHRANDVLENIRALFVNPDQGREPVDLNEVILGAMRALRGELEEHGITTHNELTPGLPPVVGHTGQLQEVILNLARNAIEAMDAVKHGSRALILRTRHDASDAITVEVQDTGPGIKPEQLDRIFEAFVTTKHRGMGLGLAICRMIVERHGGQLSVSPHSKNGALFQFNLTTQSATSLVGP
jgi:signal transduction histidine kinase